MQYKKLLAIAAFSVSTVINPGYFAGCASSTDEGDDATNEMMMLRFEGGQIELRSEPDDTTSFWLRSHTLQTLLAE